MYVKKREQLIPLMSLLLFLFAFMGCGKISVGTSLPVNEATPSGLIKAQGEFVGLNGKTVTGTAAIYTTGSFGQYVLHLSGISAPAESNLGLILVVNGEEKSSTALRYSSGSQNYPITITGYPIWNQVIIRKLGSNLDYGMAILR